MGLITRAEAVHRLKIITAILNGAVSEIRDGNWKAGGTAVDDALDKLQHVLPHIEEAADAFPDPVGGLKYGHPPIIGGMGYRGSNGGAKFSVKVPPRHDPQGGGGGKLPPKPPEPLKSPQTAIITPPQEPEKEVITFDPSRTLGTAARLSSPDDSSLTEDEMRLSMRFAALATELQDKICARYQQTGKPVTVRIRKES